MNIFKDRFSEIKKASEPLYKSPKSVQETIEILKKTKVSSCKITNFLVLYRKTKFLRKENRNGKSKISICVQ